MPSLKSLRIRINSVKSTQKITSAMKMVAASKLRRAQSQAEAARPYAERMERMLASLGASVVGSPTAPKMLVGTGSDKKQLLIVVTADRGLAGAFNTNVGRLARNVARRLEAEGKSVSMLTVGRKGRDYLRREMADRLMADGISYAGRKSINFADAQAIAERVTHMLNAGEFDVATVVYNKFGSVISQIPTEMQIIPAPMPAPMPEQEASQVPPDTALPAYEYEPAEEELLASLLPQNLAIQIYRALLESAAGEHGARMSSMDNATRNAGDMIKRLSQTYNRARQANITKELIEIISGAEAV
jgi:F-type H+-transporting ATPase subunit gamma